MTLVLDAFAGPGGWDTGLRLAGYAGYVLGIEHDGAACRTAHAAGHPRVQADVATFPLDHLAGKVAGAILSPPCGPWSGAGDRKGELDRPAVYERIAAFAAGRTPAEVVWHDERSLLTAEPMRWAVALRPRWIALEQVPAVLPLWRYTAELLRAKGYDTWCGELSAERFGVPQTRKRAMLIASLDQPVTAPVPTHQAYRHDGAYDTDDLFGTALPRPVSMAEALGWIDTAPSFVTTGNNSRIGGGQTVDYQRDTGAPSPTLTGNVSRWQVLQYERQRNGGTRPTSAPSLTIMAGHDNGNLRWTVDRPATTVCGDPRIGAPGHRDRAGGELQFGEGSVRVTVQEAGLLQSFPADYPWQGTKSKQYEQVGNAVPPLLAAAVLRPLLAAHLAEVAA